MVVVLILFILVALYQHYMEREDWPESFLISTVTSSVVGIVLSVAITIINGFAGRYDKSIEYFDVKEVRYNKVVVINSDTTSKDSILTFSDVEIVSGPSNQVKREQIVPKEDWILSVFGGHFFNLTTRVEATLSEENIKKFNEKELTD